MKATINNAPIKYAHEVMEAYLKENAPTIEDCYVGPLCNNPGVLFSPNDVVEGYMLIVQSLDWDYDMVR